MKALAWLRTSFWPAIRTDFKAGTFWTVVGGLLGQLLVWLL